MFNLEAEIEKWKKELKKSSGLEDGDMEELESHILDQIEIYLTEGCSKEEAYAKAINELGEVGVIGDEFHKTRGSNKSIRNNHYKAPWISALLPNYIKVSGRNFLRNKAYSSINILGLALGIGSCLLIFLYIQFHTDFDKQFDRSNDIYRMTLEVESETTGEINNVAYVPSEWGPGLINEYPSLEAYARFFRYGADIIINNEESNQNFYESGFFWTDSTVFSVFGLSLTKGNPTTALGRPNTIVISEKIAAKYFQDSDPIGKSLNYINGEGRISLEVTGIMPNLPDQSHFHPEFFASISTIENEWWIRDYDRIDSWTTPFWRTYVLAKPGSISESFAKDVNSFLNTKIGEGADRYDLSFQPITDIHLNSNLAGEFEANANINYIYGLGSIALLVLLVACINFMNLATARASRRMREVGIRKALGSNRAQLIGQFYGESAGMTIAAFILAVIGTELLRPYINTFTGNIIGSEYLSSGWFWIGSVVIILIVSFIAGSYPALYLSSFEPIHVLKGKLLHIQKGQLFRKALVVGQFSISVFLLISTLVISRQLQFMQEKELGIDTEHQLVIPLRGQGLQAKYSLLKQALNEFPNIKQSGAASRVLMQSFNTTDIYFPDIRAADDPVNWSMLHTDHDYPHVYDLELVEGRFFSAEYASDSSAAILNESAVKALGLDNKSVLGTRIQNRWGVDGTVVGVVKDFHYSSLHNEIEPFALLVNYAFGTRFLSVKVNGDKIQESLSYLNELWAEFSPGTPFTYSFMDMEVQSLYEAEQRESKLIIYFTVLAIIISCLGLFGLSSFMAEMKTREIGIRKVLGASVSQVALLISKGFLNQILVAFFIGSALGWYIMTYWLQGFAFRIQMGVEIILIAGILMTFITIMSVAGQSIKAGLMNPTHSLKND